MNTNKLAMSLYAYMKKYYLLYTVEQSVQLFCEQSDTYTHSSHIDWCVPLCKHIGKLCLNLLLFTFVALYLFSGGNFMFSKTHLDPHNPYRNQNTSAKVQNSVETI